MSDMSTYESVRKEIVMGREIDISSRMIVIHADLLRQEKVQLEQLSDASYGHVSRKDMDRIQSRIDDINESLKLMEYL